LEVVVVIACIDNIVIGVGVFIGTSQTEGEGRKEDG
jgi:hypothetical protein